MNGMPKKASPEDGPWGGILRVGVVAAVAAASVARPEVQQAIRFARFHVLQLTHTLSHAAAGSGAAEDGAVSGQGIRPSWRARVTASVRLAAPSLPRT